MRISEKNQWISLFVVSSLVGVICLLVPFEAPSLFIEISGTLLGFFIALSATEALRHINEERKGKNLKVRLEEELGRIKHVLDSVGSMLSYPIQTPVWDSAKQAGLLEYLNERDVVVFCGIYTSLADLNEDIRDLSYRYMRGVDPIGKDRIRSLMEKNMADIQLLLKDHMRNK